MIVQEILQTIKTIKALDFKKDIKIGYTPKTSISRQAYNSSGILNYPVIVSSTLSLDEVTMIGKALERNYTSFFAIITSFDPTTEEHNITNYIKKYHQNDEKILNIDKYIKKSDLNDALPDYINISDSYVFCLADDDHKFKKLLKESEDSLIDIIENGKTDLCCSENDEEDESDEKENNNYVVNYDELENEEQNMLKKELQKKCGKNKMCECFKYSSKSNIKSMILKESTGDYKHVFIVKNLNNNKITLLEAPVVFDDYDFKTLNAKLLKESYTNNKVYTPDLNMTILNDLTKVNNNYSLIGRGTIKEKYSMELVSEAKDKKNKHINVVTKNTFNNNNDNKFTINNNIPKNSDTKKGDNICKDVLRDNDVKKANELVPTMLHLKTYITTKEGKSEPIDYLIGIKATMHKINSELMIENIYKSFNKGKAFMNLMKLTSGEISFFKDFVFAVNTLKDEVKAKHKGNPWWDAFYKRKRMSEVSRVLNAKNQILPNSTLVVSMDEVNFIKNQYNIDLMNKNVAKQIINNLFLLGFVVVDSSISVAHFLFDGALDYQSHSFNSLERENSNSAKNVKEIMQIMGRM